MKEAEMQISFFVELGIYHWKLNSLGICIF